MPSPLRAPLAASLTGLAVLVACAWLSLTVGSRGLPAGEVLQAVTALLTGDRTGDPVEGIVQSRLDRTLIGVVVGVAVALSGAAMQGLTRNPLVLLGILGVTPGPPSRSCSGHIHSPSRYGASAVRGVV